MNRGTTIVAALAMLALGAGAGYWWAMRTQSGAISRTADAAVSTAPAKTERKILHYRNPMGLPDISPVPKKDPMGMDYVPVYEGEEEPQAAGEVKVSVDKVQKLGVRSEPAALRTLDRLVRAAGRVEVDERRLFTTAPKFEGWVEHLYVNATGQPVSKGQPLFDVYSPELISAQREYAIASEATRSLHDAGADSQDSMKRLADSSLARLKNWDVSEDQIRELAESGQSRRTLTFRSPVSGVVMEKKAVQGMRFMPGDALYQIADLSSVWILADVYEQDIALVSVGARAKVGITAYPDKIFEGRITFVYPTLRPETRTVPVRIELANPGQLLKPAMFAQVELPATNKGRVLTVPNAAVIDSGTRRIVLVQLGEGRFEPREVKLGARSDNYVEVISGVKDGEPVVVAANFLIDAESNLRAAVGGFGGSEKSTTAPADTNSTGGAQSATTPSGVGHRGEGTVQAVDAGTETLSIAHGPIASLKWPAMTMKFKVANPSLVAGLKPGASVSFEFVERSAGEWVVTKVAERNKARDDSASTHKGH
jgi:Cu(I)/Ag(I) efflux system membrane fusion protein